MDESQPTPILTPHNNLFQSGLSSPETATGLIRQMLPAEIVAQLNLSFLEKQPESFVDKELRDSHSAVSYSEMTVPDKSGQSSEMLVYFLMEHKSEPEPLIAFQLLRYLVRIWEERCGLTVLHSRHSSFGRSRTCRQN